MLPDVPLPEFFDILGMSLVEFSTEQVVLRMDVPPWFRSPYDRVHGGAVAAFLDTALGTAVIAHLSPQDRIATHQLNVNYVSFAKEQTLLCTAQVITMGQSAATAEAAIRTESGRLIAKALATFGIFVRKNRVAT